ncbi:2-oxoglutarate and iron-dependent oxygenase domain containing 1 [Cyanidiococcus yangmingshanensis]|uniref:2-oxoglutarate and iron-dependent oxygenase domain containing 1 n=1 Tax=Cyanidiococcus yangmingshanensis TaxID=2690220 RepID=A0A7J7IHM9_9RHOD|nr:2-oxoglutarate and iron-dependent oxygenase domain containing 1 [Cyanidiococcus yangmingshanensis]
MPKGRPAKRPTTLASQQRRRSKPSRHQGAYHERSDITASDFLQVRTTDSEHLRPLYAAAKPFPHIQLREVFAADSLRAVRDEVIGNCSGSLKETDIYKVYQTGELRNLDVLSSEEQTRLGKLRTLRDTLYSDAFRQFLEDLTGCCNAAQGEHLDGDQVDCSINVYTSGCHLLCHDDAIGTRRLSYILYLTDPDQAWTNEDGGRLQLFALGDRHQDKDELTEPEPYPIVSLLPAWNTMTVFQVQPGCSFHAVEEVHSTERPRLSISGWYHVQGSHNTNGLAPESSLKQLQMCRQRPLTPFAWPASAPDATPDGVAKDKTSTTVSLWTADRAYLSEFLRPEYLQDDTIRVIRKQFLRESSVQLHDFLKTKPIVQQIMDCASGDRHELATHLAEPIEEQRSIRRSTWLGNGWTAASTSDFWSIEHPPLSTIPLRRWRTR